MTRLQNSEELLRNIGIAIYKRRSELGLSQEELASRSRLHRTYISDVERGIRNVSILTLERIADALDLPVGVLLIFGKQSSGQSYKRQRG